MAFGWGVSSPVQADGKTLVLTGGTLSLATGVNFFSARYPSTVLALGSTYLAPVAAATMTSVGEANVRAVNLKARVVKTVRVRAAAASDADLELYLVVGGVRGPLLATWAGGSATATKDVAPNQAVALTQTLSVELLNKSVANTGVVSALDLEYEA